MENFFNNLKDKFLIIDYSGNILFVNNSLLNEIKYKISEISNIQLLLNTNFNIDNFINDFTKKNILNLKTSNNEIITFKSTISPGKYNNRNSIFILLEHSSEDISRSDFKYLIDNSHFTDWLKNLDDLLKQDIVTPILYYDDFIKTLCRQLGLSISNYTLSENLRLELKKRIKNEKDLSFLLKIATDITSLILPNGTLKKVNDGWCKLLGYSENELLNKNWLDITHKDDVNKLKKFINNKLFNSSSTHEICTRLLSKNGDIKWINWSCSYIHEENFIIATGRNVTEEKKLEIEKKLMEDALHVESIKNEFFANISHEFKTPLNIILASLQVIAKNINNDNIIISNDFNFNKYTNSIKQNSYRLLRLANNLIDITKIDTGYYEIHPKNCNIISIIEDITISVAQYVQDKGIELLFDTYTEELIISCDPDKIERIMLNLLSNSIKYTNSPGKIVVTIDTINNDVVISIKDSGIGISREKLPIIFERFIQVDNTLTRKCEGSGIGLSLVKSLVQMHGGKIAVYSIEGIGSEFTFTLPKVTIPNSEIIYDLDDTSHTKVEKCNIEFSDIYNI